MTATTHPSLGSDKRRNITSDQRQGKSFIVPGLVPGLDTRSQWTFRAGQGKGVRDDGLPHSHNTSDGDDPQKHGAPTLCWASPMCHTLSASLLNTPFLHAGAVRGVDLSDCSVRITRPRVLLDDSPRETTLTSTPPEGPRRPVPTRKLSPAQASVGKWTSFLWWRKARVLCLEPFPM